MARGCEDPGLLPESLGAGLGQAQRQWVPGLATAGALSVGSNVALGGAVL